MILRYFSFKGIDDCESKISNEFFLDTFELLMAFIILGNHIKQKKRNLNKTSNIDN